MTSRSSSWVDLRENNKRRMWQWCVALFFFVILNVVGFLISMMSLNTDYYMRTYGSRANAMLGEAVKGFADMFMGVSAINISFTIVLGALLGIGGYVYLDNRAKVDFYESMPLKKGSRFSVIWLSGLIIYAGSYLIGMLINYGILTASGFGSVYPIAEALRSFIILFAFYIGVYHLAILSVILTGTGFSAVCAFAVLSLYELVIRGITVLLKNDFFRYAHTIYDDYTPLLSPYGLLSLILRSIADEMPMMPQMCKLCAFDFVLLILCYILYHKRPLEASGKTLAFKRLKGILKLLITVPVAVFVADLVYGILDESSTDTFKASVVTVFVAILTAILASALIQGIFEQDIRLAFKKKLNWLLCSALALLIFFGFREDWIGLDRFVPSPSMVNTIAFYPQGYDNRYSGVDGDLEWEDLESYIRRNMYIYDASTMCDLAKLSIQRYDAEMEVLGEDEYPETGMFEYAVVYYRLKNGHTMCRQIQVPVKDEAAIDMLDKLMSSYEFKSGFYDMDKYDIRTAVNNTRMNDLSSRYSDGVWEESLTQDELNDLIELYMDDVYRCTFKDRLDEYPNGHITFMLAANDRYGRLIDYDLPIYPCMTGTMDYLKAHGHDKSTLDLREYITGISVTNYHNDEVDEYYDSLPEGEDPDYEYLESLNKSWYYDDPADIDAIITGVTSAELYTYRWDGGKDVDGNYSVNIDFAKESDISSKFGAYAPSYQFFKDEIPDFVVNDTK
ncbi:MAG: DUF6449 domain-containing protein [Lachnospiraceae bacterium]|nr:DUF6449 domain-containing protein [Lachnospiraceae bacterium]